MRQFEFEERVKMQVSQKEYEAIETVYLYSDLDKDEFCKMWVKMNKSRVEEAKEAERRRQEMDALIDKTWLVYFKVKNLIDADFDKWNDFCFSYLNKKETELVEKIGVNVTYNRLGNLRYELAQFLGIA
jgi:hypothetical protein